MEHPVESLELIITKVEAFSARGKQEVGSLLEFDKLRTSLQHWSTFHRRFHVFDAVVVFGHLVLRNHMLILPSTIGIGQTTPLDQVLLGF